MNPDTIADIAFELFSALKKQKMIQPVTDRYPDIDINDAYQISKKFLYHREIEGEKVICKKIGVTSKVVQEMLGVNQPDFGFLTNQMLIENNDVISISKYLIQPRAEAEIAFKLNQDLVGPGISKEDVITATKSLMPCFEIVDSRIDEWKIKIQDTVADNASCGVFCIGEEVEDFIDLEMDKLEVNVYKNGEFLSTGNGSAVQGHPAEAVAWLANTLGRYDIPLLKDEIILSGSLVPLEPAIPGDKFEMKINGLGSCKVVFKE